MDQTERPSRWRGRVPPWSASVLLCFGLALLTRLPALVSPQMYNVDESYLAAMGLTMGRGGHLYTDVVDRKPPVLPWLYSLSQDLLHTVDLRPMRVLAAVCVALAGVVVAALISRLGGSRRGALFGAALFVLGTAAFPPPDAQAANFELFALLPAAGAVLAVVLARDAAWQRRVVLFAIAGLLVAVGGMIKQPFFVMLLPVALEAWRGPRRLFVGGVALLSVVVGSVLIALPFGLGQTFRWAWLETSDYLDGSVGGWRVALVALFVAGLFAVLHVPTLMAMWAERRGLRAVDPVVWAWLGASAIAVIPGFHLLAHYLLLLVGPLAVASGIVLSSAAPVLRRRVVLVATATAVLCTALAAMPFANADRVSADVVAAIQQRAKPGDRILVWGALPEVYWRSGRLPAARFLSVGYITGKWADVPHPPHDPEDHRPYKARWSVFDHDLRAHPPIEVVDMTTSGLDDWRPYPPYNYAFGRILHDCYRQDQVVHGMTLWVLVDTACVQREAS